MNARAFLNCCAESRRASRVDRNLSGRGKMSDMKTITRSLKDTGLLAEGAAILDVSSSGRYWRNSHITELSLIRHGENGLTETIFLFEEESDDYNILPALTNSLEGIRELITFNGHTFDLPYLRRKYAAYDLKDPFESLLHTDLYALYRPLVRIMALPSGKLADFYEFSGNDAAALLMTTAKSSTSPSSEGSSDLPEFCSSDPTEFSNSLPNTYLGITDALRTLSILDLVSYLDAFNGKGTFQDGKMTEDHLYLRMALVTPCPHELSIHDTVFHIRISQNFLDCGIPIECGKIRIYHTDLSNYVFLPGEGYAVHRSVARFVDKSRTQKVTRETCFHYAEATPRMTEDPETAMQVLQSVLNYVKTR